MSNENTGAFVSVDSSTTLGKLFTIVAIVYWGIILAYALFPTIARAMFAVLFVGGSMVIYVCNELIKGRGELDRIETALLAGSGLIAVVGTAYLTIFFWDLFYHRPGVHFWYEYIVAVAMIAAVVYLAYRSFGIAFTVVAGVAVLYGLLGGSIPGLFGHSGLSVTRIADIWVLNISGFYGSISRIIAAWVALFLLYTGLVKAYGAFDLILRSVSFIASRSRSGVAQFSVIASMIIGSLNGSPSANSAMTGSFTIPMMKNSGMDAETAASVEATASSGGQVMPPIMGAAAFIMASLLGITYFDVLVAGLVPAAIFILAVGIGVHYGALRCAPDGLTPQIDSDLKVRAGPKLAFDILKFLIPFFVLIYTLGVAQWSVTGAALVTVIAQLITGITFPFIETLFVDRGASGFGDATREVIADTIEGFRYGAVILAPIAIIIALINGIIDIIGATGLAGALTLALMDLTGGTLLIAAVLSMVICILLGMGMPSVAAYSIVAILVAPTFVEAFLIPDLAAHYFVFYSAILSFITPPIATAAVVTSGIAGSNFWKTCFNAIRISLVLFVLPVTFLYNPALVVGGLTAETFLTAGVVMLGAIFITHGANYTGQLMNQIANYSVRAIYIAMGLVIMVYPNMTVSVGLIAVGTVMFVAQYASTIRVSVSQSVLSDRL